MSFNDNGVKQINIDIVDNVLDELRRDRKIIMVLNDEDIEDYVGLNLSEADLIDQQDDMPDLVKKALEKK